MMAKAASLVFILWSLCLSVVTAEPFLPNSMSLAFKSSLLRLSFYSDQSRLLLLVDVRGGYEGSSQHAVPTHIVTNETLSISLDKNETVNQTQEYNFSLFQSGDGSESDPDGIPARFLRMQKGNRHKAKHALDATLEWRASHQVDTILSRPHCKFDLCKVIFPHYFGGRDPTGHVIFVQRPGKICMHTAKLNNVTTDDLLMHYVYILEYCWNVIEPIPDQTMTSVIDLGGLNLRSVREMFHFVHEFVNMMSLHYPQRSYKTLLVNSPRWFGATYRLIAPILRESTRNKIQILSGGKAQREALEKYLGDLAPKELIDENNDVDAEDATGPSSPMEHELRAFVSANIGGWLFLVT
jgi:CRAL/TRIO domain